MKIGLFGGTFNPFHNGHLGIIRHVRKEFDLKKIYIIPSATPPHKPDTNLAPAQDRLEMAKASVAEDPELLISNKELIREGLSYTIDTVNAFKNEHDKDTVFYLLMGSDAFLDIDTWKSTQKLFEATRIIIMLRGEWENTNRIVCFIDENISKSYIFDKDNNVFTHKNKQNIYICTVPVIDISSTMIRDRIKNKKNITGLVPVCVENIISQKGIYT